VTELGVHSAQDFPLQSIRFTQSKTIFCALLVFVLYLASISASAQNKPEPVVSPSNPSIPTPGTTSADKVAYEEAKAFDAVFRGLNDVCVCRYIPEQLREQIDNNIGSTGKFQAQFQQAYNYARQMDAAFHAHDPQTVEQYYYLAEQVLQQIRDANRTNPDSTNRFNIPPWLIPNPWSIPGPGPPGPGVMPPYAPPRMPLLPQHPSQQKTNQERNQEVPQQKQQSLPLPPTRQDEPGGCPLNPTVPWRGPVGLPLLQQLVGGFKYTDYQEGFLRNYPEYRPFKSFLTIHHAVPQVFVERYGQLFSWAEMHSAPNLRGICKPDIYIHYQISARWNAWITSKGGVTHKFTRAEILEEAKAIDAVYGKVFYPRVP
jgi:hypothetical protein